MYVGMYIYVTMYVHTYVSSMYVLGLEVWNGCPVIWIIIHELNIQTGFFASGCLFNVYACAKNKHVKSKFK